MLVIYDYNIKFRGMERLFSRLRLKGCLYRLLNAEYVIVRGIDLLVIWWICRECGLCDMQ